MKAEREHKVHNIILYPEKHSWCQTTPIQQIVATPGYKPITIDNNICVGACYSYSIPRTQPAEPGELIGPYCDSCQPIETKCYHVTLQSDNKNPEYPKTIQKRVQIILKCSCMTCEKIHWEDCDISDQKTSELPSDLFSFNNKTNSHQHQQQKVDEIPELLHFKPEKSSRINLDVDFDTQQQQQQQQQQQPTVSDNKTTHINEQHYEINEKLIKFLKNLQNSDNDNYNDYNKDQLFELLKLIKGNDNEISDTNLLDFVNFINIHNSDDFELDLNHLKNTLINFEKNKIIYKNNFITDDNDNKHHQHHNNHHHHHHHHHLGEEMHVHGLNGQLIKGPHGSMVILGPQQPEKLHLDSDNLKPNHDGVVIAYENHNNNRKNTHPDLVSDD